MNLCRIAHTLADLAVDAIEAIIHAPHSNRAADDLWGRAADRLADIEAEEEVWEPVTRPPDTYRDELCDDGTCTCNKPMTIADATQAIDILISENSQLRADLVVARSQRDEANARATWKGMAP